MVSVSCGGSWATMVADPSAGRGGGRIRYAFPRFSDSAPPTASTPAPHAGAWYASTEPKASSGSVGPDPAPVL
jgi:hypothetical protein